MQVLSTCKSALLRSTTRLDFLVPSNFASEVGPVNLPSWDPELYFNGTWKQAWWAMQIFESRRLDQPQQPNLNQQAFRELLEDAKVLHVKGHCLGTIISAARRFCSESYGQRLLAHFVGCMEDLSVQAEEIEEFSLAMRLPENNWFPDLSGTLTQLANTSGQHGELESKIKALAAGFNSPDYRQRFVTNRSTIVRLQVNKDMSCFGMTWVKEAEPGDRVYLILGCSALWIFRPQEGTEFGR